MTFTPLLKAKVKHAYFLTKYFYFCAVYKRCLPQYLLWFLLY